MSFNNDVMVFTVVTPRISKELVVSEGHFASFFRVAILFRKGIGGRR
jgi:hypothetical protein